MKKTFVSFVFILTIVVAACALVACRPDTPIDTKGAVADIAADLKEKCNFTFSVSGTAVDNSAGERLSVYETNLLGGASTVTERQTTVVDRDTNLIKDTTTDARYVFGTYGLGFVVDVTVKGNPANNGYTDKDSVDMTVTRNGVDGTFDARDRVAAFVDTVLALLKDGESGAVFSEGADVNAVIGTTGETYVPNTGEATVLGSKIKLAFTTQKGDVTTNWTCTLDKIGETKVIVPPSIDALADYRQLPFEIRYDLTSFDETRTAVLDRMTPAENDDAAADLVAEYKFNGVFDEI